MDVKVGHMAAFRAHRVDAVLFEVAGFTLFEGEVYVKAAHGAYYLASECRPIPMHPLQKPLLAMPPVK